MSQIFSFHPLEYSKLNLQSAMAYLGALPRSIKTTMAINSYVSTVFAATRFMEAPSTVELDNVSLIAIWAIGRSKVDSNALKVLEEIQKLKIGFDRPVRIEENGTKFVTPREYASNHSSQAAIMIANGMTQSQVSQAAASVGAQNTATKSVY